MRIAVVGASAAGVAAAEALRRFGWDGELTLIGAESHVPYDRPPLSKRFLSGAWTQERLRLRDAEQLDRLGLDLRLATLATALDPTDRTLTLHTGERLRCAGVIVATGGRARTLPGAEGLTGVHTLRTLDDAHALRTLLRAAEHLGIVGNGVLGTEAAAVARELGVEVTLIGRTPLPMSRLLGDEAAALLARYHRTHGVRQLASKSVEFDSARGRLTGLRLDDGNRLAADCVLLAVGARPNTEWLPGSWDTSEGLLCDEYCAAAPGIYAAGDVARWHHPVYGRAIRVEHRTNATEQALAAARNLLAELRGQPRQPFSPVPYFWSDQYDLRIQGYGLLADTDSVELAVQGDEFPRLAALHGRAGLATGVLAVNLPPRQLRDLRSLIVTPTPWRQARARFLDAVTPTDGPG
ncbi:NAD(P)/FAD-dependent oxidoreductase [Streptomyces sp. RPT161]|uniref:NAD(P)/FAD-dependent oxidoreductase n=1 Tax=Streptomyces sp. RPT161 TaxID=3015993 RepID=UPI0022B866C0|nr:FAD-dependent oxidoreductase [Streptomyces sp. RPT161]